MCDGCEKFIYGVRHKCLNCPDWDFCSECVKSAKFIHPRHRFVPIYEPLAEPNTSATRHYGIYCDGPLCKDKENVSYIEGVRYKCAVCNDTDFCANCEAIPTNRHNRTHPLIKFKTPVRSVSVTTLGEDKNGVAFAPMGDQPARKSTATETVPVSAPVNTATQVQTIVDVKPTEQPQLKVSTEKLQIQNLLSEPTQPIKIQDLLSAPVPEAAMEMPIKSEAIPIPKAEPAKPSPEAHFVRDLVRPSGELDAHFIRDTISDGTKVVSDSQFVQVWTLRNPGPNAWPAGCSVRHVGGDNMLNLDNTQPLSQTELAEASESNVVGREVEVGEEIAFRVVLKAPKREGTAISYWRLKTADGTPFGHRLWCDIHVVAPPSPPSPSTAPAISAPPDVPESSTAAATTLKQRAQCRIDMKRILENRARLYLAQKKLSPKDTADPQTRRALDDADRAKIFQRYDARRKAIERLVDQQRALTTQHSINGQQEGVPSRAQENDQMGRFFSQLAHPIQSAEVDPLADAAPVAQAPAPEALKEEVQDEKAVVEQAPVEEPAQAATVSEPELHSSGMIFPQLEKESPASSTHEAVAILEPVQPAREASSENGETDIFEDAESVEVLEASSDEDDTFLTDEEYDILDASDEEMP